MKMKNLLFLIILLFITSSLFSADELKKEKSDLFFWKIQGESNHVYIIGSIHVADASFYPLDEIIENAYNNADVLVVEVNIADVNTEMQQFILEKGLYQDGETLQKNIPKSLYKKLDTELRKHNVNIENVNVMEPWLVGFTVTMLRILKFGYKPEYGLDYYFLNKANDLKEIKELETVELQLNIYDKLDKKTQIAYLDSTLEDEDKVKETIESIFEHWKKGNADALVDLISEDVKQNPKLKKYFKSLNEDRNINMAKKIEEYLQDDKVHFIVVGAGHIGGEKGILNLLKKKGFKIKQY